MRADDRYQGIPIVMMTSLASAVPRTRGLYEAVLAKPFTPEALMKVLEAYVVRESARPPADAERDELGG